LSPRRTEGRKLHNEELNDLYSSPNIIRGIKSRRIRGPGARSAYRRQDRSIPGFGGGYLRKTDHLGDLGVDGSIILNGY